MVKIKGQIRKKAYKNLFLQVLKNPHYRIFFNFRIFSDLF